jgi:hypothetical protein
MPRRATSPETVQARRHKSASPRSLAGAGSVRRAAPRAIEQNRHSRSLGRRGWTDSECRICSVASAAERVLGKGSYSRRSRYALGACYGVARYLGSHGPPTLERQRVSWLVTPPNRQRRFSLGRHDRGALRPASPSGSADGAGAAPGGGADHRAGRATTRPGESSLTSGQRPRRLTWAHRDRSVGRGRHSLRRPLGSAGYVRIVSAAR